MDKDKAIDFDAALAEERTLGGMPPQGKALGLAFSGGGIRSATFNLGVIQALAELKLLRRFDYLSTISGGGYIGAWLTLFIKRYAGGKVADAEEKLLGRDANGLEHPAIRFLRASSKYHLHYTLGAVTTYLSNLLLNVTILVTLMGLLLLVPRIAALGADRLQAWGRFDTWYDAIMVALLVAPTFAVALGLLYRPPTRGVHRPWFMRRAALIALIDVPVLDAAFIAAAFYVQAATRGEYVAGSWFRSVLLAYVLLWALGVLLAVVFLPEAKGQFRQLVSRDNAKWHAAFLAFAALAGAIGAALLLGVARAIGAVPDEHRIWVGVTFGPPAVIGVFMVMVVAHLGFMGNLFTESDRQLWRYYIARLLPLALTWTSIFCIAFYGPVLLRLLADWSLAIAGILWIGIPLIAVLVAIGILSAEYVEAWVAVAQKSMGRAASFVLVSPWLVMRFVSSAAPYVFVFGSLIILSWGVHYTLQWADEARGGAVSAAAPHMLVGAAAGSHLRVDPVPGRPVVTERGREEPGPWQQFVSIAASEYGSIRRWFYPPWALPWMVVGLFIASLLLSWRLNINQFSLHHFYRDRLTRCYLGATNPERKPHALTGFDPEDDVPLAELAGQKPLHIVGTAINLNRGRQLAWQSRRAASFSFTPLHAGYETASAQVSGGYRPVAEYGKDASGQPIMLGTTVAISGAATRPKVGHHISPASAFLTTLFNVRPGRWCGDTGHAWAWRRSDPALGLRYWLAELTGTADQDYPFVSLSDGGHFENLGIYELVRRRCRVILASDAGADPKYAFEDLAEAMRKCYTDFGVEIRFSDKFKVDSIRPDQKEETERHYAIADIMYPNGAPTGTLIYWKASITADMPPDIMHYRRTINDFPHEFAAEYVFDESQFERYRHLGDEVAKRSIEGMRAEGALPAELG